MVPHCGWFCFDHPVSAPYSHSNPITIPADYIDISALLLSKNSYFQKLKPNTRELFIKRVREFIDKKIVSGQQGLVVSSAMKVHIAAAAVQLTIGLETWDLSFFKHILIYPAEYQNPVTKNYHKGETNMGGFICFSWKDFMAGNENPTDKLNLGFHEFAHALRFNGLKGHPSDYFFEHYFKRWLACASKAFKLLQDNSPSIFRKYGAVNLDEFFSVAIETFFETPLEFKTYFPDLYHQTCILLNQTYTVEGGWEINCREKLIHQTNAQLNTDYPELLHHHVAFNKLAVFSIILVLAGILFLFSARPILFLSISAWLMASVCWGIFEFNYNRLVVEASQLKLRKGFFLLKGYKTTIVPLSRLVSLMVEDFTVIMSASKSHQKKPVILTLTYYESSYFYEEKVYGTADASRLLVFTKELRKNFIMSGIKNDSF